MKSCLLSLFAASSCRARRLTQLKPKLAGAQAVMVACAFLAAALWPVSSRAQAHRNASFFYPYHEVRQTPSRLYVRINGQSLISNGQSANFESWKYWTQWAIQRWND